MQTKLVQKTKKLLGVLAIMALILGVFFVIVPHARAANTYYVNGNTGNDANSGLTLALAKKTISNAITTASAGDTIVVVAATYNEDLVIDKKLTITGKQADGTTDSWVVGTAGATIPDCPVITYDGANLEMINFAANEIVFKGFEIDTGGDATTGVKFEPAGASVSTAVISYCSFSMDATPDIGITVDNGKTLNYGTFTYNYFNGPSNGAADSFTVGAGTDETGDGGIVNDITFSNNVVRKATSKLLLDGDIANVAYRNNTFSQTAGCIKLAEPVNQAAAKYTTLVVSGNTFNNGSLDEYAVYVDADVENADVTTSWTADLKVNDNAIYMAAGNTYETVAFETGVVRTTYMDATNNYWGSDNGPTADDNTFNTASQGADASPYIDFTPWRKTSASGTSFSPVTILTTGYPSIQSAITDAAAGSTINVAAGTFSEGLTINNKELTIDGATAATTIVRPAEADVTADITYTTGAPLDVLTLKDLTLDSAATAATDYPVSIANNSKYITIQDCIIDSTGAAAKGINVAGTSDHLNVGITDHGNTFSYDTTGTDSAIDFNPLTVNSVGTDNNIEANTFSPVSGTAHLALRLGNIDGLTVKNNTFNNAARVAIYIGGGDVDSTNLEVVGNTFGDSATEGIIFMREDADSDGGLANINIHDNDFNSRNDGVYFYCDTADPDLSLQEENIPGTVLVNENNFHAYGAAESAIRTGAAGSDLEITINATSNYWGSANGPDDDNNPYNVASQGADITNNSGATYTYVRWWKTAPTGTVGAYTGTLWAPVYSTPNYYCSIQAAINAETAGDTINVIAGDYSEDLDISKQLTLVGKKADGITDAWTTGTSGFNAGPSITYDGANAEMINFGANGIVMRGFEIDTTGAATQGIKFEPGSGTVTGATIEYNSFVMDGTNTDRGISVDDGYVANNVTIRYCDFNGPVAGTSDWFTVGAGTAAAGDGGSVSNTNLSYNTVREATSQLQLDRAIAGVTYAYNTFDQTKGGILLREPNNNATGKFSNIDVINNVFNNGTLDEYAVLADDEVDDADLLNGSWAIDLQVNNNVIDTLGTNTYPTGFEGGVARGSEIDATGNYWGSSSGPYNVTSNPAGVGAEVSDYVDYTPYDISRGWLKSGKAASNVTLAVFGTKLYQARIKPGTLLLYTRSTSDGITWSAWVNGGAAKGSVAMTTFGSKLYQAKCGPNNYLYTRSSSDGTTWSAWVSGGTCKNTVSMLVFNGKLYQAKRALDDGFYTRFTSDGTTWSAWAKSGSTIGSITMVSFNGKIYQMKRTSGNGAYLRSSADGTTWSAWTSCGSTLGEVALTSFNGRLYQAKRASDGNLYTRSSANGTNWNSWVSGGATVGNVTMVSFNSQLYQFKRKSGNTVYFRSSLNGITWSDWIAETSAVSDISVAEFGNELYQALRDADNDVYVTTF